MCQEYVEATAEYMLEFSCRLKTHLFLHLANDLFEFGPISCYNTERYEAFNSIVRCQNIYGNRHSPSKDIANNFATTENLRFVCEGGCHDNTMYVKLFFHFNCLHIIDVGKDLKSCTIVHKCNCFLME
jgi:hypothetical protein